MTVASSSHAADSRPRHRFKLALVDLDDTLYRVEEVPRLVRAKIEEYIHTHLGMDKSETQKLTADLYVKYGTTMAGLVALGYHIDYDMWHAHVHGSLEYEELLQPDPHVRDVLQRINVPCYILTNADVKHTERCLQRIGIQDCFQGVFAFENVQELAAKCKGKMSALPAPSDAAAALPPPAAGAAARVPVLCKPARQTYELVLEQFGVSPHEAIFLDDSPRNIAAAHDLGIFTVLVGRDTPVPGADFAVNSVLDLPAALPELFVTADGTPTSAPLPLPPVSGPRYRADTADIEVDATTA